MLPGKCIFLILLLALQNFPHVRNHDSLLSHQQSQFSTEYMLNIYYLLTDLGSTNYKQERERKRKHMAGHVVGEGAGEEWLERVETLHP